MLSGIPNTSATTGSPWWTGVRQVFTNGSIAIALVMGAMGQIMTFVPGAQMGWYAIAAAFAAAALLSPRWWLRIVALALVIGFVCLSYWGYLEGLRYQEFLRHRGSIGQVFQGPSGGDLPRIDMWQKRQKAI